MLLLSLEKTGYLSLGAIGFATQTGRAAARHSRDLRAQKIPRWLPREIRGGAERRPFAEQTTRWPPTKSPDFSGPYYASGSGPTELSMTTQLAAYAEVSIAPGTKVISWDVRDESVLRRIPNNWLQPH